MGYLSAMPNEYKAKGYEYPNPANYNNNDIVGSLVSWIPVGIFDFVSGKMASGSKQSAGDETDERITYLENEQKQILAKLSCNGPQDFDTKLNEQYTEYTKVANATNEKTKLEAELELLPSNSDAPNIEDAITQKKKDIADQDKIINGRNVEDLKKQYEDTQKLMQQYLDNQKELDKISNGGVIDTAKGMKEFTSALKKWQNAKPETKPSLAKDVFDVYQKMNKSNSVTLSVKQLWELYDQEIQNDINNTGKRSN